MMKGRPAIYATFSSYDEVAHHSGLERADTLEALRKLDQQFGRIARARRYAPRPYEIVVLSDHGQTQGATFKQRNGYGARRPRARSLAAGDVAAVGGGDENQTRTSAAPCARRPARQAREGAKNDVSGEDVVVLGSGNLGLVYLMDEPRRLTLEEIDERHPELLAGAPRASARRLAARALGASTAPIVLGAARHALPRRRPRRGRGPARALLARTPPRTCCARTASRTSPTSWSAASTTRTWSRAARSRS